VADDLIDPPLSALLPGRVGLVVRLVSRDRTRAAVLDSVHRYMDALDAEPGTEAFVVATDPDDEDIVWLFEWFADDDAMAAHRASAPFAELMGELSERLGAPPAVVRLDPLRVSLQRVVTEGKTVPGVFDA
jgi:quinol monooxygenase YgiN